MIEEFVLMLAILFGVDAALDLIAIRRLRTRVSELEGETDE